GYRDGAAVTVRLDRNSGQCFAGGRHNLAGEKRRAFRRERRFRRHESMGGCHDNGRECRSNVKTGFHRGDLSPVRARRGPSLRLLLFEKPDDTLSTKAIKERPQSLSPRLADAAWLAHPSGEQLAGRADPDTSRERPEVKRGKRHEEIFARSC